MSVEAHKLKVENHQSYLLLELHNLQKGGHFCDITLQAEDGVVRAHGAVLVAASPHLRKWWLSSGSADEASRPDLLDFKHIKLSVLQCVVDFIYTGELIVTSNSLNDVHEFCSELGLQEAVKVCQDSAKVCQDSLKVCQDSAKVCQDSAKVCQDSAKLGQDAPCMKSTINNIHTSPKANKTVTEHSLIKDDTKSNKKLESDHYEDSTDEENISESDVKVKQKTNKTNRKRSKNVLGNEQRERGKKRKKTSKKDDGRLEKTLKVPKISILFKEKKAKDVVGETKLSRRKQLKPEKKSKAKKLTDIKCAKESSVNGTSLGNKSIVKQEIASDTEENLTQKQTSSEQNGDKLTATVKKDDSGVINTSLEETVIPKECPICKEMFNDLKSFSKHMKTHNNTKAKGRRSKQEVWPCCVCGRKLTSAVRQACHHYSKHGIPYDENLKLHTCDVEGCKYITASGHYLQIHKKGRHGNERPHVCEFCGKGFKLPSALVTHLNIHTNSKIFKCEKCNLTFNQKGGLDVHEKKHHKGQASWTELCHLCSEKFLQKAELSWHMYTVHQIPLPDRYKVYSCDLCDYQTIRRNKLERHQDSHNDKRTWTCDNCGKKFVNKSYLNRHMRYHGEKSFKCTFDGCNYACVDNIGLKKHIRLMHTHKNYKPFVCSLCNYKSGLRGNLDKHIRTVHQLDVVTKHTVHLKMKFKGRQSGDILSKDGKLVNVVQDHRNDDPRRLQANYILDDSDDDEEQEDSDDRPVDMVMKDGDEETYSQDSEQPSSTRQSTSQMTGFPYVYNGMQYLTPYTMVPLPSQLHQGEMYTNVDPITLTAKLSEFY